MGISLADSETSAGAPDDGKAQRRNMAGEPTRNTGLAGRYATALFELAIEQNAADAVARDFATLKALLVECPDLARLVRAPVFSAEEQRLGMDAVLRRMEAAPLTVRFVLTLANKAPTLRTRCHHSRFRGHARPSEGRNRRGGFFRAVAERCGNGRVETCSESKAGPRCAAVAQGRSFASRRSCREGRLAHDQFVAAHQARRACAPP